MNMLRRALRALGRAVTRAAFLVLVVVVAMFPLPVMPIVLAIQKRRRREVVAQVDPARRPVRRA
jgi:hypothetical protein